MKKPKNGNGRARESQKLTERIAELEETLRAIRMGEVDALLVSSPEGDQVFTLQGAEHPYRVLVETIDEGAAILAEDGTVLYSNQSFAKFFDISLEKFIGAPLYSLVFGRDREFLKTLIAGAKLAVTRGEIRVQHDNNKPRTIRLTLSPNRELGVDAICAVATELTEIVETNEALRVTETSLRQLSARLLQLQDEERRRIARDLHDTTGQKLVVLSMTLDRLARHSDLRKSEAQEALKEGREIAEKIAEEIRTLSYLLHPPLLDEVGFRSAAEWYVEGFSKRSGIEVTFDFAAEYQRLPVAVETALFRILQESLTNVHRHSKAKQARVRYLRQREYTILEIRDFGCGIAAERLAGLREVNGETGIGLAGMRERLNELNGRLELESDEHGTSIRAIVPLLTTMQLPTTMPYVPAGECGQVSQCASAD